jgi:ribulose-5-phosphate 4-epimerase/fuculose-1-phosphate aldolase
MSELSDVLDNLVVANRILAHENVVDAYGHVSIRHPSNPKRYFIARSLAPELVTRADLIEFDLEGNPVGGDTRTPYLERFIHGAIFEQRPDVMAICHNHTLSILPFSISKSVRLRAVIHSARVIGSEVPVWNIADEFGDETNLLVVNMDQGRSLARTLGAGRLALMRGHGSVVVGADLPQVVSACINMDKNAQVQLQALQLGEYIPLAMGELDRPEPATGAPPLPDRAWEYWSRRAGF